MAKYLLPLTLALLATAEQPGAVSPTTAPSRSLKLGQLNFLHTTDTHGWHAGHLLEGQYSGDFGDYISFIHHMREKTDAVGADLVVVDTGDRVEGNGLFDASTPQGLHLYDILKEVDYDVLIPGNHELYIPAIVDAEYSKMALPTKKNYIASNIDYIHPETGNQIPLGQRYRVFKTKNQGIKIAAFGFLYNFTVSAENTFIQFVDDTIKESWFQKAIREDVDLFLVCVHMPLNEYEIQAIYRAIRSQNKDIPIQIFGSHSHIRNFVKYDSKAAGLQSGRYFETIGWASINGVKKNGQFGSADEVSFHRRYIDNNILAYRYHTGLNETEFPTEHGKNVTSLIAKARKTLDLDFKYGCVPRHISYLRSTFDRNDSIGNWIAYELLPGIAKKYQQRANVTTFLMLNSGFMRYDLVKGPFTRDTSYIFTPFNDSFKVIRGVPYKVALEIANRGFTDRRIFDEQPMTPVISKKKTPIRSRNLDTKSIDRDMQSLDGQDVINASGQQVLVKGYTTIDDYGSDGDDTLHLPLGDLLKPPEIITSITGLPAEGEPETVDLAFNKFLTSLILTLINKMGYSFDITNVEDYSEENIRDIVSQWIQDNWSDGC